MKCLKVIVLFLAGMCVQTALSAVSITDQLADGRVLLLNDYFLTNNTPPTWVHQGTTSSNAATTGLLPGSTHIHRAGWVFQDCRMGKWLGANRFYIPPWGVDTNFSANMRNTTNAAIYSPIFTNGIGTLYFEARNAFYLATYSPEIVVEIATNTTNGSELSGTGSSTNADINWQLLFSETLAGQTSNYFIRVAETLDIRRPVAVRIRRATTNGTTLENYYVCIDNIRVSPSVPDLSFSEINSVVDAEGTFVECKISNTPGTLAPTDHTSRDVQLWYRWVSPDVTNEWDSIAMAYDLATGVAGDGEKWKADNIPFNPRMALEYYFSFTGDTVYQSPDYTEQGEFYPVETGGRHPREGFLLQPAGDDVQVTVQFDAQGGTVTPGEQNYIVGWRYDSFPTPDYLGYVFAGWFDNADCFGAALTEASIVSDEVTVLYAKWIPNTYLVRYNGNNGSGLMPDSTFTYGVEGNLTTNEFTREGYSFSGWANEALSSTVAYTNGASVLNLSVIQGSTNTLYAVWRANSYTLTFDPQGGIATPGSKEVVFGSPYGVLVTPNREGYSLSGWYLDPDSEGTRITAESTVAIARDHTSYAVWTANTYTVHFNAQGGAVLPSSTSVTYGSLYGVLPVPTRLGFIFGGWFTAADGAGERIAATTPVVITETQTLFAKWMSNTDWYTTNSVASTYIIFEAEELMGFSLLVNAGTEFSGKTVMLGADIDMASIPPWIPIGTNEAAVFTGTFNGQGKVISGVSVNSGSSGNVGLFGVLGVGGVIRDVNVTLAGSTLSGDTVGGLVGCNYGLVQNSQVLSGSITGTQYVGGLVGLNYGIIQNGFSTAIVSAGTAKGGIAGQNESEASIQNCYWLIDGATTAIGGGGGTVNGVYSFSGSPGTLAGTVFDTQLLSEALNAWVREQNASYYWWTEGTDVSHPTLTFIAPPQVTGELSEDRILRFNDYFLTNNTPPTWVHQGTTSSNASMTGLLPGSTHIHRAGWVFQDCRMGKWFGSANRFYIPPWGVDNNYSANMRNTTNAVIYSPMFTNGIGTLYFEVRNASYLATYTPEIVVEVATNMTYGTELSGEMTSVDVNWQWFFSMPLIGETSNDFVRVMEKLDIRRPVAIRIRRASVNGTTLENYYICIDNIRVSLPPADIVLSKPPAPFDNGYPSVNTPGSRALCEIANLPGPYLTSYPGGTRTNVQIVSRWNYIQEIANPLAGWVTPWQTNSFNCIHIGNGVGDGEKWEGIVPQYPDVGSLEYYFVAAYNGVNYKSPDYTEQGYDYPAESTSPKIYSEGGTAETPFKFDIRQYPAAFGEAIAVTDQFGEIPMYLSGTNEWQARISVVGTSYSNITWYFKGTGEYLGDYTFSDDTVYWCNQTGIKHGTLPYGDNCRRTLDLDIATNETNRFEVQIIPEESNYVLLTLDTSKTNFVAGRGEFQDFNIWNGNDHYFTHTFDKYPKTSYEQNFDVWALSQYHGISNHWGAIAITNVANIPTLEQTSDVNAPWCEMGSFEYAVERTAHSEAPESIGTSQWRNQALRLFGGTQYLGLGYFQGNDTQVSDSYGVRGIGTVSGVARLSRLVKNNSSYCFEPAIYTQGYTKSNYMLRVYLSISDMSPEAPSISAIVYYQSPYAFYEYRMTQVADPMDFQSNNQVVQVDSKLQHQLIKWQNSVPTVLANVISSTAQKLSGVDSGNSFELRAFNETGGVRFVGQFRLEEMFNVRDTSPHCTFGTFGVVSSECVISMAANTIVRDTATGADDSGMNAISPLSGVNVGNWSLSPIYERSSNTFRTKALSNRIRVLLRNTLTEPWVEYSTIPVENYQYQTFSAQVEEWRSKYVRLQVAGAQSQAVNSDIVLDGVTLTSWRGEDSVLGGWRVVNGWVSTNASVSDRVAHLNASQADPALAQSVQSPRMMGVGSFSFDYRVLNGPATLKIQYTEDISPAAGSLTSWYDLGEESTIVCPDDNTGWLTFSRYYGEFAETNLTLRILNDRSDDNADAIIEINNIVILNNPTNSPNDWIAYNARITATDTNRWWIDTEKSAFLNNSPTAGVDPVQPQNDFNPYIMSPKLTKGLGQVSFLARAYNPENATETNTVVSVQATTNAWSVKIPDSQWETIHTFTLHTNAFYRPYSVALTNGLNRYTAVRLAINDGKVGGSGIQRVCLDEVLISEQIYAKFDISSVKLLLSPDTKTEQPMEGQDLGVEAQLTNMLLYPTNITVRVSYVTGTNTWGIFNTAHKLEMRLVDPADADGRQNVYRTPEPFMVYGIPEQDRNTVVQYIVSAEYEEVGKSGRYEIQQEMITFTNPEWYEPIDLNKRFGATPDRWSPYYIVYDVPPGAVWINEINAQEDGTGSNDNRFPYLEIAVPGWMDLNGWSIDFLSLSTSKPLTNTLTISSTAVSKNLDEASGYAFYVLGDYSSPVLQTDYRIFNLSSYMATTPYIFGVRLKRPSGIYEQTIVYDWMPTLINPNGAIWAGQIKDGSASYVGYDDYGGSLSFTGTVSDEVGRYIREDSTNTWVSGGGMSTTAYNYNWTPGEPNQGGQVLPPVPEPGGSNVVVTSTMSSTNGTQNGIQGGTHLIKVRKNTSTNIVYEANSWYRLYSVQSNGAEMLPLAPTNRYTLRLNNLQSNVTVFARLDLREDVKDQGVPSDWLEQFGEAPLAPTYLNKLYSDTQLSLLERYWINANPTKTNVFTFTMADKNELIYEGDPPQRILYLTLGMALNNERIERLQGGSVVKARMTQNLSPADWTTISQYILSEKTFDSENKSRVYLHVFDYDPSAFFKWSLQLEDPRLSVFEMINQPKP